MRDPFGNTKRTLNRLIQIMNFLIIFMKKIINRKKNQKFPIYLLELVQELKIKTETIILSNTLNDRNNDE